MKYICKTSLLFLLVVSSAVASAAGNFYQDPTTGIGPVGDIASWPYQDDLILTDTAYQIDHIRTYVQYGDANSYTVNIYDNYHDQGGNLLASYSVDQSGVSADEYLGQYWGEAYDVDFDTSGLTLGPGTYIINFTAQGVQGADFYWFTANWNSPNGNEAYADDGGFSSEWDGNSFDYSWDFDATPVPEPASLLAIGLGAAVVLRRRAKKN